MSTENQEGLLVTPGAEASRMAEIRQGKRRADEPPEDIEGRRSQAPRLTEQSTIRITPSGRGRASTATRSAAPGAPTPGAQDVAETIEIDESTKYINTKDIPNIKARLIKKDGVLEFVRTELGKLFTKQGQLIVKGDNLKQRLEDMYDNIQIASKERMIERRKYWRTGLIKAKDNLEAELKKLEKLCKELPRAERREKFQEDFVEEAEKWFEGAENDVETFDGLIKFLSIH